MNRKRISSLFAILILLLLMATPVMAQESPPIADSASWLPTTAMIVLTVTILALTTLAAYAFKIVGISVPAQAFQPIANPVAASLRENIAEERRRAAQTPSPTDDFWVNLKAAPVEFLLNELQERGIIVKYVEEGSEGQPTNTAENEQSPLI